jgi:ketosteroid isomerase-like protein
MMKTTISNPEVKQKIEPISANEKEEVSQQLMKIWDEMREGSKNWDRIKAASIWTNDGINMPSYDVSQSREEMLDFIEDIVSNNRWEFGDFKPLELFVHGDMAYEFSLFDHKMIPNDGGATVHTKMRCITVYKKEDGVWKIHRWMPQYADN